MIKYIIIGLIISYLIFVIIKKIKEIKKGKYCSGCSENGTCTKCNKK